MYMVCVSEGEAGMKDENSTENPQCELCGAYIRQGLCDCYTEQPWERDEGLGWTRDDRPGGQGNE